MQMQNKQLDLMNMRMKCGDAFLCNPIPNVRAKRAATTAAPLERGVSLHVLRML